MKTESGTTRPPKGRTAFRIRAAAWTGAIGAALLLSACGDSAGIDPLVRKTHLGDIRGAVDIASATYSWKGIPYAKAPVGALRWQPPQEPEAWT